MAVIGNKPATNFQAIKKQTITGNGDSSYTLDYSVSNANDLEVFVNNVRQEPTIAYSATSQTITFSEAIDSTDDVYMIYQGQTMGSVVHPNDQALTATTGTFSDDVSIKSALPKLKIEETTGSANVELFLKQHNNITEGTKLRYESSTGHTYLDTIYSAGHLYIRTNVDSDGAVGKVGIEVTNEGYVLKPKQVHFHARPTNNINLTAGNDHQTIIMDTVVRNIGSGYSGTTGIFTAPVSGVYFFAANCRYDGANSGGYIRTIIHNAGTGSPDTSPWTEYNDTLMSIIGNNHSTDYHTVSTSGAMYCDAGDKIYLEGAHNNDTAISVLVESQFTGVLIG